MKRIDFISKWLQDRRRTYADGLSLFLATATEGMLTKYGKQLQIAANPHEFSIEFTILINKLTEIRKNAIAFPAQFPGAYKELVTSIIDTLTSKEILCIIEDKQAKRDLLLAKLASKFALQPFSVLEPTGSDPSPDDIAAQLDEHTAQLEDLSSQQEDSASQIEDNAEDLANMQEQFDALTEQTITDIQAQIDALSTDIDELKKPGVKFIKESSLPAAMAKNYNRIKEIVPLMASLHGELSSESLTDEQRKDIATQLCDLDDEKRALWDAIDVWSESTGVNASALRDATAVATAGAPAEETAGAPGATATDGSLEAGAAIARRLLQVKQNITRSQASLDIATQEENAKKIKSAQARLDKYQVELTELESQIKGE